MTTKFKCLPECKSICCGVVPFEKGKLIELSGKMQVEPKKILPLDDIEVVPITEDMICVFLNRETFKCEVYEDRPSICKMYGTSKRDDMACPYIKPNGNPRSEAQKKQVFRMMKKFRDEMIKNNFKGGIKVVGRLR